MNIFNTIYKKVAGMFGDVKYFKYPLFLLYDPTDYYFSNEDYVNLTDQLKFGDIILRTYDHYLDGLIIPGFYSHAAIYVGDNKIIHAVGDGVSYTDTFEFCKCDGVAIVRPKTTEENKKLACEYAVAQLGKEYDFWFNFENENVYCCTELVYWSYKEVLSVTPILTKKFFGLVKQEIISPDAFLTDKNCEFIWESSYGKNKRK